MFYEIHTSKDIITLSADKTTNFNILFMLPSLNRAWYSYRKDMKSLLIIVRFNYHKLQRDQRQSVERKRKRSQKKTEVHFGVKNSLMRCLCLILTLVCLQCSNQIMTVGVCFCVSKISNSNSCFELLVPPVPDWCLSNKPNPNMLWLCMVLPQPNKAPVC